MSDTPRTDAVKTQIVNEEGLLKYHTMNLERELANANERIRQMQGWRVYAEHLENFAEVHMSTFVDRDKWNEVKAGRPKDE